MGVRGDDVNHSSMEHLYRLASHLLAKPPNDCARGHYIQTPDATSRFNNSSFRFHPRHALRMSENGHITGREQVEKQSIDIWRQDMMWRFDQHITAIVECEYASGLQLT